MLGFHNGEPKQTGPLGRFQPERPAFPVGYVFFAGHPRAGWLCRRDNPHRVDWRLSRPVLISFQGAVSEKCREAVIFSLDPGPADDQRAEDRSALRFPLSQEFG
jgi:hypothetical protein